MKKLVYFLLTLIFTIYVIYIKFYIPVEFVSYENYHWISFLNTIYDSWFNSLRSIISWITYIFNDLPKPDHWFVSRLFYGYVFNFLNYENISIFQIQSFLSILSSIIFWIIVFKISDKNKYLFFISLGLFLTIPHQIKYWYTEDFYILWNLVLSISVLLYVYFLERKKIVFILWSSLFFLLALYTRNLYLLYLPIFLILTIYYWITQNKFNKNFYIVLLLNFALLLYFIIDRLTVLIGLNDNFSGNFNNNIFTNFHYYYWIIQSYISLFPLYLYIFFIIWIWVFFYLDKKIRYLYIIFICYLFILLFKFISIWVALERHMLFLAPLIIFNISIWIFLSYKFLSRYRYNCGNAFLFIITTCLLIQPFVYKQQITQKYSVQEEFSFLEENVGLLWNDFNLVITNNKFWVNYAFPKYLLKDKKYKMYTIDWEENQSFPSFINAEEILNEKNIFYVSTSCYSSWDRENNHLQDNWVRDDCKSLVDDYELTPIITKDIIALEYIIPRINSNLWTLKIWFYEIGNKR